MALLTAFERRYQRTPITAQEIRLSFAMEDGWSVVTWEDDRVCLVLRGSRYNRTRYAEIPNDGRFIHGAHPTVRY